ncbi:hypothetical protein P8C59_003105 [Phyllachora maydis]|uniref:Uncharacterized protein n=1 Tax=Phyllachora maydis TaxID=1825666 RepID=A0AAD9I0T2_9PEZI|nr:hypothetical protein P8C59_003105 [Phyllachora maydis]
MPFSTLFLKVHFNVQFFKGKRNTIIEPAKITPAIRRTAAYKAKQYKSAKARAIAGRAAAAKRRKNDVGRYTTNSGLIANKDDNNAYNRAYMPPTKAEKEEKGSSSNDNSINSGTSNSTNKGKGSGAYKCSKGTSYCKDILLYKR